MSDLERFLKARVEALETKAAELERLVTELENEKIKNINVIEFNEL